MAQDNPIILVPYDFTELSDYAVKHAVQYSKIIETDIAFLHIIPDLREETEAVNRLKAVAEAFTNKYGVNIKTIVRPGIIHKAIKNIAQNINAGLVIMKTSGVVGLQRYTGSRAVKMMMGARIPFIVVQAPPQSLALRRVVFPIDFRQENKQKLKWISFLSRFYTSKIFLVKPSASEYAVRNNLEFAKRFLEGRNIDFEIVTGKERYNLTNDSLEYAHKIKADLIIIMLSNSINISKTIFGLKEQKYITNKYKIPVMCLNPRTDLRKIGGFY